MSLNAVFSERPSRIAIAVIVALLLVRLVLVVVSPLELYADEAQYWRWSRVPEWGYYSKPPMIAWLIACSTAVFGNSEWAIRIFAPVLHAVAGGVLFVLARKMFGARAGLAAVCAYLFMPGVVVSSGVMSTDGVLLPFWCLALYLLWRLRLGEGGWTGALALGLVLGAGFLSKYAMIYFVPGMILACLFDVPTRRALCSRRGIAVAAIVAGVLAPHIVWHVNNRFKTIHHTLDNASLDNPFFRPEQLYGFVADQMGVFGPFSLVILVVALACTCFWPGRRDGAGDACRSFARSKIVWLSCFVLPVLIIIAGQSVLSRAHANWAATAYPAASILIAGFVTGYPGWRYLFWSGIGLQAGLAVIVPVLVLGPQSWAAALGRDNDLKRVRGWKELAGQLVQTVQHIGPTAVLVDEREVWHGLDYYMRDHLDIPLVLWRYNATATSFAEEYTSVDDSSDERILVASYHSDHRVRIRADFRVWQPAGLVGVDLGHRPNGCPLRRELRLYVAAGHVPLKRDAEWTGRFRQQGANGKWTDIHLDRLPPCPAPGRQARSSIRQPGDSRGDFSSANSVQTP